MSVVSKPYFSVHCDFPRCTTDSGDDSDYSAWSDAGQAYDVVNDSEWLVIEDGGDYCPEHTVETDELDEDGEPVLAPARDTFEFELDLAFGMAERRARMEFNRLVNSLRHAGDDDRRAFEKRRYTRQREMAGSIR